MSSTNDGPAISNGYIAFIAQAKDCETRFLETYKSDNPDIIGREAAETLKNLRHASSCSDKIRSMVIKDQKTIEASIAELQKLFSDPENKSAQDIHKSVIDSLVACWTKSEFPDVTTHNFETQLKDLTKADESIGAYVQGRYLSTFQTCDQVLEDWYAVLDTAKSLVDEHPGDGTATTENAPTLNETPLAETTQGKRPNPDEEQQAETTENTSQASETPSTGSKRLRITFIDLLNP